MFQFTYLWFNKFAKIAHISWSDKIFQQPIHILCINSLHLIHQPSKIQAEKLLLLRFRMLGYFSYFSHFNDFLAPSVLNKSVWTLPNTWVHYFYHCQHIPSGVIIQICIQFPSVFGVLCRCSPKEHDCSNLCRCSNLRRFTVP